MIKHYQILIFVLLFPLNTFARHIDLLVGFFSISAETQTQSSSLSGPGSYRVAYAQDIFDHWEFLVGYNLTLASGISGDMGYGWDIGVNYYHFSQARAPRYKTEKEVIIIKEKWRPYLGFNFSQRQFQSVSSSYSGFGIQVGSEYQYSEKWKLKGEIRYTSYAGPNTSEATETNILIGPVFDF